MQVSLLRNRGGVEARKLAAGFHSFFRIHIMLNMNASHLTIRNLPEEVSVALKNEKQRRGTSLNQTVIEILRQSLGASGTRSNGLAHLAGTWSEADQREFLNAVEPLNKIDRELWK